MSPRLILAALTVIGATLAPTMAPATHTCDSNPDCNGGRGAVRGYVCLRSEVNHLGNEFNGRICEQHPRGQTWYIYARSILNRDWITVCRNEEMVVSLPSPAHPSVCQIPPHA